MEIMSWKCDFDTLALNWALCTFQVVIDLTCFEFFALFSLFLQCVAGDQTLNTSNNRLSITSCMIWFEFASHSNSFKGTALLTNWNFPFFVFAAFCIVYPSNTKWSQKHFKLFPFISCILFVSCETEAKWALGRNVSQTQFFFQKFQQFVYPNSCNNHYQPLCWHYII